MSKKIALASAQQRRWLLQSLSLPFIAANFPSLSHAADTLVITHPRAESVSDERSNYPLRMLELALQKSGLAFRLQAAKQTMPQSRAVLQLASNLDISVMWSMTSRQRERELLPIRIPLDMGLLGWRIFLIRQSQQERFSTIAHLQDLQKFTAVQGHDWPDTEILRNSGLKVESNPHYEFLFTMLAKGLVDYFPRSVLEIWDEEKKHGGLGLAIEQSVVLQYPTALYYFVNKNNTKLASTIENGLRLAIKDGSFAQLFNQFHADIMRSANLNTRRRILLPNPLLPEATPLQQKDLWLR
jgi:hypothetical protein